MKKIDDVEIKNAIVQSASISCSDHGVLSAWLTLEYDCGCQGFGGYTLYLPKSFSHHNIASPAGHFIFRCLEICGVERWDDIPGKTVRVKSEHSKVHAIGHIVKDDWFNPSVDFKEFNK